MRAEKANHLKDKMEELSLSSSKANLVESFGTVVTGRFKSKHKKVLKRTYEEQKTIHQVGESNSKI